jgi:hypothetical protein
MPLASACAAAAATWRSFRSLSMSATTEADNARPARVGDRHLACCHYEHMGWGVYNSDQEWDYVSYKNPRWERVAKRELAKSADPWQIVPGRVASGGEIADPVAEEPNLW